MWKINLKQSIRYILNQKKYTLVITSGLAVGLVAAFLIFSYVFYEKSFDSFHTRGDNLYRIIVTNNQTGSDAYKSPYSYAPQGPVAFNEVPGVKKYVRLMGDSKVVISTNDLNNATMFSEEDYYYADESFFELFSFPLIFGNPENVLKDPGTVVLSSSISNKLFGQENPVGQEIKVDGRYTMRVTGVFEDIPENTHLKFNLLFSLTTFPWIMNEGNAWGNHSFFTYLLLEDGRDANKIASKITSCYLKKDRAVNQDDCTWELQPIEEAYLNNSNLTSKPGIFKFCDERIVYFMSLIAILILCIAWINYINLATAKSTEREKEIAVRRTNGAGRKQLITQLFTETLLYNIVAIVLATLIIFVCFDWFQNTMGYTFPLKKCPQFWLVFISAILIGIFIPGFVTTLSTSKINPFKASLFQKNSFRKTSYRNALVVFQFVIIISLLIGVVAVNKQLTYLHNVDLGFQKEQVVVLNCPRINGEELMNNKFQVFRENLMKYSGIENVTASVSVPGERFGYGNGGPYVIGEESGDSYFRVGRVYPNYLEFSGINLIAGRNFYPDEEQNSDMLIINEEGVKEFGFENPEDAIQERVRWRNSYFTILGVTQSFHQQSLHIQPEPMIMTTTAFSNDFNYILVKVNTVDFKSVLSDIEKEYNAHFVDNPFSYFFLDSFFDQQYKKDLLFRKMFSFFSVIALIIGYIGLYGLTTFRIIKRIKEIGIRKVNGASSCEILSHLNKDFVSWVCIAFIIGSPLAWYGLQKWLENFAYKTPLSWWIFILAGFSTLVIAMLTVSLQSWRAAARNPVEALRYE